MVQPLCVWLVTAHAVAFHAHKGTAERKETMATISKYVDEYRISGDDGTTNYVRPVNDDSTDWYVIEYPPFGGGAPRQHKVSDLGTALAYVMVHAVQDMTAL